MMHDHTFVAEELQTDVAAEREAEIEQIKAIARAVERFFMGLMLLAGTALLLSMAVRSAPVIASHFAGQVR
jgi:hypothetical protein